MYSLLLNIIDDIEDGFLKNFSETIPTEDILFSIFVAFIAIIIVDFIYKKTYVGVSYTKSFSLSLLLLTLVTSIVIRTINSNLSLSLGMVGALSIVRFRTAIKDPVDTIFMFWAITIGIMSGAGLYLVTIISTLIIGILYFINYMIQIKKTNKLLLIVVCDKERAKLIINKLKNKKRCALKTEMYKADYSELTYEIAKRNDIEDILAMNDSEGITSINVLDID